MLTQEYIKKIFTYNHETGELVWAIKPRQNVSIGDIAGCDHLGYVRVTINRKGYLAHRLAWLYVYGEWPKELLDHINHIKTDNRIENLREVTHQGNQRNAGVRKDNKSGLPGVAWHARIGKWQVRISVNDKEKHLGYFSDIFNAVCARKSAQNKYGYHQNHGM